MDENHFATRYRVIVGAESREKRRENQGNKRGTYLKHLASTLSRIHQIRQLFQHQPAQPRTDSTSQPGAFNNILQQMQSPTHSKGNEALQQLVHQQAVTTGLDPSLVKAVVQAESAFNPAAVSKAGAQGLMQLMPGTAQGLGVQNSFDPAQNVEGGTRYLKGLISKYQSVPKALAAYNAGPGNVDKYNGIPPFTETQNYVRRVLELQQQYQAQSTVGEG